ncbi:MAG: hypothetical protein CMN25_13395 [Salinicola sp.]|uniref:capsular polysaccharide export protein, LipB/KpsS family n=1 Tax=uncultured Salinicola sp. TaxID=1193542 RepID=UPI000C8E3C5D|nr:hypothetical protein [uncultured Salinicola sp.]MAM58325.1 hypothetical protein [Salinicola sp.]
MSKLTKLIKKPRLFFYDALGKKLYPERHQPKSQSAKKKSTQPPTSQSKVVEKDELPDWFNPYTSEKIQAVINKGLPTYLYMPWIAEHGNALIKKIDGDSYNLVPFDLVKGDNPYQLRREILKFARENPFLYRRMVARKLIPIKNNIAAFIFTFDWAPVMRIIASVCDELGIKKILIPHESVFVDKDKYYWCPKSFASMPISDVVLGWGKLQEDIFTSRGYPQNRFIRVGAPKFDAYHKYSPSLTREQYCRLFGLEATKKIVLFASQPLDSQLDMKTARESQRAAISDLITICSEKDLQLIVRLPPSKDDILGADLRNKAQDLEFFSVDDSRCYFVQPEEAIFHSDIVTSVNSTMLFEAVLCDRPTFSMKYVDFDQIWTNVGIKSITNISELRSYVGDILNSKYSVSESGMDWASKMFGVGEFDGNASCRIREFLTDNAVYGNNIVPFGTGIERAIKGEVVDVMAIPSSAETWGGVQKYVQPMLNARQRVDSSAGLKSIDTLVSVDLFVQWGITPKPEKRKQREVASSLGKSILIIEDGFIRSMDIGLSGEPTLSIILDDRTSYYNAEKPSRLELLLNNDTEIDAEKIANCKKIINKIVTGRISKYNHAPDVPITIGTRNKKKILLVDQRYGDQSVTSGLAGQHAFDQMLAEAMEDNPDADIIIKQHPDAIKGGKKSYYNNDKLAFSKHMPNIFLVDYDINPHALFDIVDDVYVVTSGMGFEALMAGKKVFCYGAPFYSGWGVTTDKIKVERRAKKRSVEDIFYYSYVYLSRYYSKEKKAPCSLETLVDEFVALKLNQS